jgi:hypothetical protein
MVIFTDAYDALYQDGIEHIKKSFLKTKARLLFSAECGCWPQLQRGPGEEAGVKWRDGRDLCDNAYPKSPTDYRWLNSGA